MTTSEPDSTCPRCGAVLPLAVLSGGGTCHYCGEVLAPNPAFSPDKRALTPEERAAVAAQAEMYRQINATIEQTRTRSRTMSTVVTLALLLTFAVAVAARWYMAQQQAAAAAPAADRHASAQAAAPGR